MLLIQSIDMQNPFDEIAYLPLSITRTCGISKDQRDRSRALTVAEVGDLTVSLTVLYYAKDKTFCLAYVRS